MTELVALQPQIGARPPDAGKPIATRRATPWPAIGLLLPLGVLFALGFAIPLLTVAKFSLDSYSADTGQVSGWSFAQFQHVFSTPLLRDLMLRTFGLSLITTAISVLLSYPLAIAITRGPSRVRGALMAVVLMPLMISVVVKTFGWTVLLGSSALPQRILDGLHIPVKLLFTQVGVMIGLVHTYMPFMVLSLVASLAAMDRRTEEAAASLGSGPWRVFRTVTFPQTLNGLAAGSVLTFAASLSALVTPQLLGGGKVSTIVTTIYDQATSAQNFPLASALGIVLLLLTMVIMFAQASVVRRATR
jgi:putative spermidine/putrescine transport system permease protein